MDVAHPGLPDVSGHLVTEDKPARTDLPGMDHARCAVLHNYLTYYGWLANGRSAADLQTKSTTYFTAYGAGAEALRPRLDPTLAAFLDAIILPPAEAGRARESFFFWVSDICEPDRLLEEDVINDLFDEPRGSLVCLYDINIGHAGYATGGMLYHQGYHQAALFMHMDDHDFAKPIMARREAWHPLETVLSNWIHLIHIGKVVASPVEAPSLFGSEKAGPWEWRPYSEAQVFACVEAWDRLCDAIETRRGLLPSIPLASGTAIMEPKPLVAPAVLDAALVPSPSFVRSFLTRARRPTFKHIAPGLLLPPADTDAFVASQPFTQLSPNLSPNIVPPVCLFSTAPGGPLADFARLEANPFSTDAFLPNGFYTKNGTVPPQIPSGVYSEGVHRGDYDNSEEGFRLLLPYALEGCPFEPWEDPEPAPRGARKSDGSFSRRSSTELFQHGYKPFGGDYYRAQRLQRLFGQWRRLVVDGVWAVGADGVEGGIEKFREAEGTRWREYVIPPSW
jgi:hypothetical protein